MPAQMAAALAHYVTAPGDEWTLGPTAGAPNGGQTHQSLRVNHEKLKRSRKGRGWGGSTPEISGP